MIVKKSVLLAAFSFLALTSSALANDVTVTVKKGETLQVISQENYGTTRRWSEILSWNHDVIKDANNLIIGTKITIKDPKIDVAASTPTSAPLAAEAIAPVVKKSLKVHKTQTFSSIEENTTGEVSNTAESEDGTPAAIEVSADREASASKHTRAPASVVTNVHAPTVVVVDHTTSSTAVATDVNSIQAYHELEY